MTQQINAFDEKQLAQQAVAYPPSRLFERPSRPRSVVVEEVDGGFIINAYDACGDVTRSLAPNHHQLGRKLKAWANPTPAVPPAPAIPGGLA